MKVLIDIGHPAHVHLFKNLILNLRKDGHEPMITARDKDCALALLKSCGLSYIYSYKAGQNLAGFVAETIGKIIALLRIIRKYNPDLLVTVADPSYAYAAKLTGKKTIMFTDSEGARFTNLVTSPFADVICTPSCFTRNLGRKQIRYKGYHELAYLHPNHFEPDRSVLSDLGLAKDSRFVVLRFVAWQASHDFRQHGLPADAKRRLVEELERYAQVFTISESPLPSEFENYRLPVSPERIHDLLYYATLLVGDSQTMTTEAAVLGTPAIRWNSCKGN